MDSLITSLYSMLFSSYGSSFLGSSPVQSTYDPYASQISADQSQISSYQQLESALTTFQTAMSALETQDSVSPALATSSNSAVATAAAASTATTGTYNIDVTQLATAQTVTSGAFADPNTTVVGSGTLTIQLGTYDSGTNTFTAGATPSVSISVSNGSLNDIATAINNAGAGVTATVVQDSAGYHLALTSSATGQANAFQVSVADADGNNTDTSGLSQLAYDPTAAVGAGQNLTLSQAAQDAALTVNGVATTSASNTGVTAGSGLSVNLLQAGSTTVDVSLNYSSLQTAAQNFVDAYNSLLGTVNSLTSSGGALYGDSAATSLAMDMANGAMQTLAGSGSFNTLAQIGIGMNADGTLSLDSSALQTAFNSDPTGTVSVLNQAAQSFDTLATQYDQAGGTIPASVQSLQDQITLLQSQDVTGSLDSSFFSQQFAAQRYQLMMSLMNQSVIQEMYSAGTNSQQSSLFTPLLA